MRRKGEKLHGWLALDKPLGLSSTQAMAKARACLGAQKAGHGGTLDPLASGVLPLAFGEATKLIPFIMDSSKAYHFTVRWGVARTTDDAEGEVTATHAARPNAAAIQSVLPEFIGHILQTPPAYSAIKVQGERAYDRARAGESVTMTAREVQVHELGLLSCSDADHAEFSVTCGKGTYVRAIARDLALKLGTCGHVTALRRVRVGVFKACMTISLEKLTQLAHKGEALTELLPIDAVLDDIPARVVDQQEALCLRQGRALTAAPNDPIDRPMLARTAEGEPVAMVENREGQLRVVRGFNL
jgi:tRNA pseudouridine55 synthase